MTLYTINQELINAVESAIDPETGEIIDEDMLKAVDSLQMMRDEKIENIVLFIKNLRSDAKQLKEEEENLRKRRQASENKAQRLLDYLDQNLSGEKFRSSDGLAVVSYRRSTSVNVVNSGMLSDRFLTIPEPIPNKTEIKKALQNGEVVDGAELVTKQNIQIK